MAFSKVREFLPHLAHTRLAITAWRVVMLYAAIIISQILNYAYNADLYGDIAYSEVWMLFKGSIYFGNLSVVYTVGLFLVLSIIPVTDKIWHSRAYRYMLFASYILPVVFVLLASNMGDIVYYHYTHKRCTAEEIFFVDNSNTLPLMVEFMWENWYLVVAYLALIGLIAWGYRLNFRTEYPTCATTSGKESSRLRRYTSIALQHLLFVLLVLTYGTGSARGGYSLLSRAPYMTHAMYYTTSPSKANLILSNPFCIVRTIRGHVDNRNYYDAKTLEEIYTPLHYPERYHSDKFGMLEGYNVVVFILESFSAEHSAYLMPDIHDNGGYTPHLDELMRNGMAFEKCFSNGATSRGAPPAIWSSIPSYDVIFMRMHESIAEGTSMPQLLADKGYTTAFFCGSEHNSMGFGSYAHIAGIDKLYSMEEYADKYSMDDYDGKWGIWDEPFLKYMGEELSSFKEPFFASVFTITSHHPFNVPEEVEDELPKGTTLAHRPVAYTDRAIGRFMERFKDEEWFDHTLFVFIGDHVSSERILERTSHTPGRFHVLGLMFTPDGSLNEDYPHVFSQVDIMPTVLGLVGNDTPYFAIGRDIFNEPERKPFTLIYTGFTYSGVCDDYVLEFDGENVVGAYRHDDIRQQHDIRNEVDAEATDSLIRAVMQQYSTHVNQMDYIP